MPSGLCPEQEQRKDKMSLDRPCWTAGCVQSMRGHTPGPRPPQGTYLSWDSGLLRGLPLDSGLQRGHNPWDLGLLRGHTPGPRPPEETYLLDLALLRGHTPGPRLPEETYPQTQAS